MSLCRWFYVNALTERRLALKPFRSHRVLHWSLNYCLTWPGSIKNNVHEPCQDLGRGLGSHKTGLSPLVMSLLTVPRRCSWYCSSETNLDLFIELQLSFYSIHVHIMIRIQRSVENVALHMIIYQNVRLGL